MPTGRPSSMPPGKLPARHPPRRYARCRPGAARDVFLDVTWDIALPTKAAPGYASFHPSASNHPATGADMPSERASGQRHEEPPAVHANIAFERSRSSCGSCRPVTTPASAASGARPRCRLSVSRTASPATRTFPGADPPHDREYAQSTGPLPHRAARRDRPADREALGLRQEDLHFLASSRSLGCPVQGTHLHVRRRTDNPNRAPAKSRHPRYLPVTPDIVAFCTDPARTEPGGRRGRDRHGVRPPLPAPAGTGRETHPNAKNVFDRLARRAGHPARPTCRATPRPPAGYVREWTGTWCKSCWVGRGGRRPRGRATGGSCTGGPAGSARNRSSAPR